ncbi:hypothetical protein BGX34_003594 [Mortierella sp. NVP85]|nr:hypothetical protein BGX34_003594 [Mortierella sp. NVP85]
MVDEDLAATDPSPEEMSTAASQAPVMRSQGHRDEVEVQYPPSSTSHYQEKIDNKRNLLEQLQRLQQQMEDLFGKVQQTDEQAQNTQQQLLDPIEKILRTSREMDQHHTEQIQRMTQLSDLQTQQFEAVLQTLQLQSEEMMGQADQRTQQIKEEQQFMQLLQHLFVEILNKVQQLDQHNQQLGIIRQELQQTSQRTHASQYQLRQEIRQVQQKLQQTEQQAQQPQQPQYQHLFEEPQRTVQQLLKDAPRRFLAFFETNQRVIRWKDIQLCFKNPLYVMYGEDVVLPLTGDNHEDGSLGRRPKGPKYSDIINTTGLATTTTTTTTTTTPIIISATPGSGAPAAIGIIQHDHTNARGL